MAHWPVQCKWRRCLDKNMKILVVDDFSTMRRIVRNLLVELGFSNPLIQEADDGENALIMLRNQPFDLVVTDWNMPNMSGIEFLQKLRETGNDVTFGFATTEVSPEMRALATDAGASFLIGKPFAAADFAQALSAYID